MSSDDVYYSQIILNPYYFSFIDVTCSGLTHPKGGVWTRDRVYVDRKYTGPLERKVETLTISVEVQRFGLRVSKDRDFVFS